MNQNQRLLQMLKRGPVTPIDALQEIGCFRLSARIKELRESGYNIHTELAFSGGKRYAVYTLREKQTA